jgi:hypothetical protein
LSYTRLARSSVSFSHRSVGASYPSHTRVRGMINRYQGKSHAHAAIYEGTFRALRECAAEHERPQPTRSHSLDQCYSLGFVRGLDLPRD